MPSDNITTIPRVLHQTARINEIPKRWKHTVHATQAMHPGWRYELWTNERGRRYVSENHPELAETFLRYERDIMRADVIRYVVLNDFGGVYCDLDYEFLRPYDYSGADLLVAMEFDKAYGDGFEQIAGFLIGSAPGHAFWRDVLDELIANPPLTDTYRDVVDATGPGFLTRVFLANRDKYTGVRVEPRPVFNPFRMRSRHERKLLLNSGVTHGIHHSWGSWRERWTPTYLRTKFAKLLGLPDPALVDRPAVVDSPRRAA